MVSAGQREQHDQRGQKHGFFLGTDAGDWHHNAHAAVMKTASSDGSLVQFCVIT
jgi:hypothetical protein